MTQSRAGSAMEAAVNVGVGYLVSVGISLLALPAVGCSVTVASASGVGVVYMAASFVRGFLVRRLFERRAGRAQWQSARGR